MNHRHYSWLDQALTQVNRGLTTLFTVAASARANPADAINEQPLFLKERQQSAAMMRVNHSGEICAQALYYGQELVARQPSTRALLQKAASEETDHLSWTEQRILELNSHTSYLNPWWYGNSLLIGMMAGLVGDSWSLGFVEETEHQVAQHLNSICNSYPNKIIRVMPSSNKCITMKSIMAILHTQQELSRFRLALKV